MKKMFLSAVAFAVVAVSAVAVAPTTSEAIPAFARQTGAACLACHFQRIPKLNAFGRNFKINAYRDMGEGALLEDDALSLPMAFNASMLFKIQIRNKKGLVGSDVDGALPVGTPAVAGTESLGIAYPEEAAFLTGGRLGTNAGAFTEWAGGPLSYKLYTAWDLDAGTLGVGVYSTDALGMGWALQDPSNVITRNTRASQYRPAYFNNMMMTGVTGIGVYFSSDLLFIGGAANVPNAGANTPDFPDGFAALDPSYFLRAAVTTEVAGLDGVFGFYYAGGTNNATNLAAVTGGAVNIASVAGYTQYGLDAQLQGDLGDTSVGIYANYHLKGENPYVAAQSDATDDTGYFITADVAFGHAGLRVGYASNTIGLATAARTVILGAWYSLAQNIELDVEYQGTTQSGAASTSQTTLLIEYVY